MNEVNPELAIETLVKYLLYLNIVFVIVSVIKGNDLSTFLCSLNLGFLLLRQGIKQKINVIMKHTF